jgi:excinuclease UvrABC nuclease subunit
MKVLKWKMAMAPNFSAVPEKAGIYIISTIQEENNAYKAKYVGEAENLQAQVKLHFSKAEKNKELKAHIDEKYMMKFSYSEIECKIEREGMVAYLHQTFNPPFNRPPQDKGVIVCTVPGVRKH